MRRIADLALIGDTETAGLVCKDGSLDWLCVPRFDSGACFSALLGDRQHGRWKISPAHPSPRVSRRYRPGTLVLETEFTTPEGVVRLIDCMPVRDQVPDVVRIVEGVSGQVPMRFELNPTFDYGAVEPWVLPLADGRWSFVGGPDALVVDSGVLLERHHHRLTSEFTVSAGQRIPFVLSWHSSHRPAEKRIDAEVAVRQTAAFWLDWSYRCTYSGPWQEDVRSSLVVLKALTFAPTGGIVAAATTSLPEWPRGVRNWDYRYCWLRDATFTLYALMMGGYRGEAVAWRDWLLRSVAGDPSKLQIMYGVAGERRLPEIPLPWLPGFGGARPVRIGNAAVGQLQLDVYGEVMDALYQARRFGVLDRPEAWDLERALTCFLESCWTEADEGLWEVRGPRQHFTHSKVMAWVTFDRAVKTAHLMRLDTPEVRRWAATRDAIHAEICKRAWSEKKRSFTQAFDSECLDASVLLLPQVGFLHANDPRIVGTVEAIERELMRDGWVLRYDTRSTDDGLPPGEGAFLACSFWLADAYALIGRVDDARALFQRLLALRNDVGLLAEQYDPLTGSLLGNFPQAFSHVGLVNTAMNLTPKQSAPAAHRQSENGEQPRG